MCRGRQLRWLSASCAASALLLSSAPTPAAAESPAPTLDSKSPIAAEPRSFEVEAYEKRFDVARQTAKSHLATQRRGAGIVTQLEAVQGEDYAGVWFDNNAGEFVVPRLPSTDRAKVEASLTGAYLGGDFRIVPAQYSWEELEETQERANIALEGLIEGHVVQTSLDPRTNAVIVHQSEEASKGARAQVEAFVGEESVQTEVRLESAESFQAEPAACKSSTKACDRPPVAGVYIEDSTGARGCTEGFKGVGKVFENRFVLTAGHCYSGGYEHWRAYDSSGEVHYLGKVEEHSFGPGDWAKIRLNGETAKGDKDWWEGEGAAFPSKAVTWEGGGNSTTKIEIEGSSYIGESVCHSGATTGSSCGTVAAIDKTWAYNGATVYHMTEVTGGSFCIDHGDSGGPVFAGVTALGIADAMLAEGIPGCGSHTAAYTEVTEAAESMGLTVGPRSGAPPSAETEAATGIQGRQATFNGKVDPNGLSTTYYFEYGTSLSFGSSTSGKSAGAGWNAFTVGETVSLLPQTTYYFRLVASNSGGTGYGQAKSFTTPSAPPAVTLGAVTGVGSGKATLHGEIDPGGEYNYPYYRFEWGKSSSPYENVQSKQNLGPSKEKASVEYSLTGLKGQTTYYYRLFSENTLFPSESHGTGEAKSSFTTPDWRPAMSTGSATELTQGAATLNGTVNPNGFSSKYYFEYGTTKSYGSKSSESSLEGTEAVAVSKKFYGLEFGRLYHYRIVASNAEGTTTGEDRTFTLGWALESTPNPFGAKESWQEDVSCSSSSQCMAVGYYRNSSGVEVPFESLWNGSGWSYEVVLNPSESSAAYLKGVSCPSSTICAAVGYYMHSKTKRATPISGVWKGSFWSVPTMVIPTGGAEIYTYPEDVSCALTNACVAVGSYITRSGPGEKEESKALAEYWNGSKWELMTVPSPESSKWAYLKGVSCTSSTACTAVGFYLPNSGPWRSFAARWNGTEWKLQTTPHPGGSNKSYLQSVSCGSASSCVATGYGYEPWVTLVEHWNGSEWKIQSTPNSEVDLTGVSCTSATACIATGTYNNGKELTVLPERWDGTEWTLQSAPGPEGTLKAIESVSCTSSTECMTVGTFENASKVPVTLALRYSKTYPKAPTVTTKAATSVTETGATLNGTVNPNKSLTEYHFEYGKTISYGSSTSTVSAGEEGSAVEVSKSIAGLTPGTVYHYRVVASNENPNTSYSSDATFTTPGPPSATTEAASPDFKTGESATLYATVNPRAYSTSYQFEYGTSPGSYTIKVPASPKSIGSGISDEKVNETITELTPGVRYYYRVVASNSAGKTDGSEQSFVAPDKPDAVTLEATEVSEYAAWLKGELITHGSKVKYRFEYGTTKSYGLEVPYPAEEVGPDPEETVVEGFPEKLEPQTTYHYRIVAESPMGNAYGEDETFTTLEAPSTVLCNTHESPTCESPAETFTMSPQGGTLLKFLTGALTILCLNVSSTVEPLGSGDPQLLHVSALSLTGCGALSSHSDCSVTVEELPLLGLKRAGLDIGLLSIESGLLRLQCMSWGINCTYNLAGLEFEVEGGNPMALTAAETPLEEIGGKFSCPGETYLDSTQVSSQELHILE